LIVLGFAAVPVGIAVCLACGLEPWAAALIAGGAALPLLLIGFRLAEKAPAPPLTPATDSPTKPEPPDNRTGLRELARVAVLALFAGLVAFASGAHPFWAIFAVATCVCGWVVLFDGAGHIAPQLVLLFLGGGDGPDPTRGSTRFAFGFVWALLAGAAAYTLVRGGN
jgi:hypothetical protein